MRGIVIAWTMIVTVAVVVLGIWFILNASPLIPSILMLGDGGLLFVLSGILVRDYR